MPGTFVFRPIEANLTHNTEWIGRMDPYCAFIVGNKRINSQICKKGGKHPHWNDSITIPVANESKLMVELMDKDKITHDDHIGSFMIDLQEIEAQGTISRWYPLYHKNKPAGEILLEAAFEGGAPLTGSTFNQGGLAQKEGLYQEGMYGQSNISNESNLGYAGGLGTQSTLTQREEVILNQPQITEEYRSHQAAVGESHRTFVEQHQTVQPHTFLKEVDVVETRPVLKEIEVLEPHKVMKEVQYTEAVPVKKQIETIEPHVVMKDVEVIEPRLVTKQIQVIENVPVMKHVEVIESTPVIKEIETFEPQTFTKTVEVTEQVPTMKQVTVTEPVHLKKAVEFVEPIITTQTITKEVQPAVVIDEKVTKEIGPASVIGLESEFKKASYYETRLGGVQLSEQERLYQERLSQERLTEQERLGLSEQERLRLAEQERLSREGLGQGNLSSNWTTEKRTEYTSGYSGAFGKDQQFKNI